ncbi:MAG: hypothetical protein HXK38_00095 [Atopobium sp.]|nr:hypothetical protein [Atopobium sp.]MBS5328439.1 hypothetical protein [Atopobium sp.]
MALIGFFKVIYIPLTVLYLIAAYVLLAKQSLSKIFKRTNFDLFRGGVLALYYFFIAMVFFVNIMLLTTKTVVKQQFLVPYIVGIIAIAVACAIFTQIAKHSKSDCFITIRDLVVPLIWLVSSFVYTQRIFELLLATK